LIDEEITAHELDFLETTNPDVVRFTNLPLVGLPLLRLSPPQINVPSICALIKYRNSTLPSYNGKQQWTER
jgi:hypothetical protein